MTLPAGTPNWSTVREVKVRAYYNDVPRFVVFCFKQENVDCDHTHVGVVSCNSDPTHTLCQEDFIEPLRSRKHDFTGTPSHQPTACGLFGGAMPCHTCTCCQPLEISPIHCGIRLWSAASRLDYEKIDLTFESPVTEVQCPIPFCEDFEACGSAPEERFGTADCDATGFYCSPTHVLEAQLGDSNYWRHEAISGIAPVYLAAVLWLPPVWALPANYSNDVLILAAEGDPDDANPYFEGAALRILSDDSGLASVYAIGAFGRLGSTWNTFGTPTLLCLGTPNCIQVRYWAGDNTLPPSLGSFPVGTVNANGIEVGREVRARNDTDTPHAEGVIFGAVAYPSDPSALSDTIWLDDVCYGQTAWITCACSCPPATGDVYLTRAIAPEYEDPSWSPPSAAGVVNLRGVSADSSGDGTAGPGVDAGDVHLGGARIKLG